MTIKSLGKTVDDIQIFKGQEPSGISLETVEVIKEYLHKNGLHDVCVFLDKVDCDVLKDRIELNPKLRASDKISLKQFPWGNIKFSDHYNPFPNSILLVSDNAAIALHEGGHAKDYASRKDVLSYASNEFRLLQEFRASKNAFNYINEEKKGNLLPLFYQTCIPGFSTYLAGDFRLAVLIYFAFKGMIHTPVLIKSIFNRNIKFNVVFANLLGNMSLLNLISSFGSYLICLSGEELGRYLAKEPNLKIERNSKELYTPFVWVLMALLYKANNLEKRSA